MHSHLTSRDDADYRLYPPILDTNQGAVKETLPTRESCFASTISSLYTNEFDIFLHQNTSVKFSLVTPRQYMSLRDTHDVSGWSLCLVLLRREKTRRKYARLAATSHRVNMDFNLKGNASLRVRFTPWSEQFCLTRLPRAFITGMPMHKNQFAISSLITPSSLPVKSIEQNAQSLSADLQRRVPCRSRVPYQ